MEERVELSDPRPPSGSSGSGWMDSVDGLNEGWVQEGFCLVGG